MADHGRRDDIRTLFRSRPCLPGRLRPNGRADLFSRGEAVMSFPRQCVILVGGLGTRLGPLTSATPKPLLPCGDRPFLHWLMRELVRFGVNDFLLLAGFEAAQVQDFATTVEERLPKKVTIAVSQEPEASGTGGALWHAREMLEAQFMLVNGDSWFDVNLAAFNRCAIADDDALACILLRKSSEAASRFSAVEMRNGFITAFHERPAATSGALTNAGIYCLHRRFVGHLGPRCSLEKDIFPKLAGGRMLRGVAMDGYFVDIGVPEDYKRACAELPQRLRRPAIFFDRDGVLNKDLGWVGRAEDFRWKDGAIAALRDVNDRGFHAFVVTNQSGIARGFYSESDLLELHSWILDQLSPQGATIDDWRWCPHHPAAPIRRFRVNCDCRKPRPGMVQSLMKSWEIDASKSLLIGDKPTDLLAASAAGIASTLYDGSAPLNIVLAETLSQLTSTRR